MAQLEEQTLATASATDANIEAQLEQSGQLAVRTAQALQITTQADYETAGKYLVGIKTRTNQIKEYWKGPKEAANAAHKAVVEREKQMLRPLQEAEKILKANMLKYQAAVEKARREQEEAARKRQQEEVERLLNQAADAGAKGDATGEAVGLAMAEMVNDMPAVAQMETPSAAGTSIKRTWKARVTEPTRVPAYFNGLEIRTVNQTALNNIAKMTKGTAKIPGVEFYLDATLSART